MKILLICTLSLLLSGCSLFHTTPNDVIKAQRAVYQSVLVNQASAEKIIDTYVTDCKKLITYHANYVFQLRLHEIDSSGQPQSWEQSKTEQRKDVELRRDKEIKKAFASLEKRAATLRAQVKKNHGISLKLIGSIYNYMSTTPIEIDNMEFWVNKLDQISKQQDEVK